MRLSIFRFHPERDAKPYMQDFDVQPGPHDAMLLDLILIATAGNPYHALTSAADARRRIDAILERVRRREHH